MAVVAWALVEVALELRDRYAVRGPARCEADRVVELPTAIEQVAVERIDGDVTFGRVLLARDLAPGSARPS